MVFSFSGKRPIGCDTQLRALKGPAVIVNRPRGVGVGGGMTTIIIIIIIIHLKVERSNVNVSI